MGNCKSNKHEKNSEDINDLKQQKLLLIIEQRLKSHSNDIHEKMLKLNEKLDNNLKLSAHTINKQDDVEIKYKNLEDKNDFLKQRLQSLKDMKIPKVESPGNFFDLSKIDQL